MNLLWIISTVVMCGSPGAANPKSDVTALQKPISVLSKPVTALKGDPRVTRTVAPPTNNVWLGIQTTLDRSNGYIVPDEINELNWLDLQRAQRWGLIDALRPFDLFELQRDRDLRIEQANMSADDRERARRRELDRRQYLLWVYRDTGFVVAAQASADEQALQKVEETRQTAIAKASDQYNDAMRAVGGSPSERAAERQRIEAVYQFERDRIRRDYDDARSRILGVDSK